MVKPIKSYSPEEVESLLVSMGFPRYRTGQLLSWLYVKQARSYDDMTDLPGSMRTMLAKSYPLYIPAVEERQISRDGTRKYLVSLFDGVLVETVGIPSADGRLTVCCSTQAGCAMNCTFCATGKAGLTRSLYAGEIADQVLTVQNDFGRRVSNVVLMGQGEPFSNYDNTIGALRILNGAKLLDIGARHITVSTCGILKGIERFSKEPEQFTLAISLHSAVQDTRDLLMPTLKHAPLTALKRELLRYTERTNRRVTLEYALIKGVNDSSEHLEALAAFCKGVLCHVNIIMFNDIPESPYRPVPQRTLSQWEQRLSARNVNSTVRQSRGSDIDGACGQLANSRRAQ